MAGRLAVVTGITGKQGGSAADSLLKAGYKVRGLTRDPNKPSGKQWTDRGVELVTGDLDNVDELKAAFKGANVLFVNTDYWSAMGISACHQKAAETGTPVTAIVQKLETQWGINAIDAAATTVDTLDIFVLSTLSYASRLSSGNHSKTHHFDAKGAQVEHLFTTPGLAELKKKTSLIHMPFFINNWKIPGSEILMPVKQSDGSFTLFLPVKPDKKVPMGDPVELAGPFTVGLTKVPPGKNLVAMSGMMNFIEWCEKCSQATGKVVRYEECSPQVIIDAIPGGVGEELADMFLYFNNHGYDGSDKTAIYPDQLGVDVKVASIDDYFRTEDWSKMLNQ